MSHAILVIGGLDPAGCSGLAADVRAATALGAHAAPVATALTAQNTRGVQRVSPVDASTVAAQLRSVLDDLDVRAVKVGLLGSAAAIEAIADALAARDVPLVLDPVLGASTGAALVDDATRAALLERLVPRATLVTPNAPEAEALTGVAVRDLEGATAAGRALLARGCGAVLVKGGHLDPPGTDVLVTAAGATVLSARPLAAPNGRGTGCVLATAAAVSLAAGEAPAVAVAHARCFVRGALAAGYPVGAGPGPVGATRRARVGRLHVLTDDPVVAQEAVAGGADVVQYREKRPLPLARLADTARLLVGLGATCIVNDRVDVAAAVGAGGVHLGRDDLDPATARRLLGPGPLVGATVNSVDEARAALARWGSAIDYLGAGPVFGTRSKANPAPDLGLEALAAIAALSPVPVVAIGGLTPERVPAVLAAGAHGVAVLSGVTGAADRRAAVAAFAEALA